MMRSREQSIFEIPSITRHLKKIESISKKEKVFSIFIAPYIHDDSIFMSDFTKYHYKLDIKPLSISDYITEVNKNKKLLDFIN